MNSATIEWDDNTLTYSDNESTSKWFRYENKSVDKLAGMMDGLKSLSIYKYFFESTDYDNLVIPILSSQSHAKVQSIDAAYDDMIIIESVTINISELYKILALKVQSYMINNYDDPELIIIGDDLLPAIENGKLPSSKFKLNLQRWYKVLYIPNFKGITVLGESDI